MAEDGQSVQMWKIADNEEQRLKDTAEERERKRAAKASLVGSLKQSTQSVSGLIRAAVSACRC